MKHLVFFLLTISVLFDISIQTAAGDTLPTGIESQPNDDTVRTFSVKTFDRVRITGPFVVTIMGGNSFSVKASGPSLDLGAMAISSQNGTLLVQYTPVKRSENPNIDHGVVTVRITLPILKKAEFMELTRFSIKGFNELEYLDLIASDMANGFAEVNARNLRFTVHQLSSLVVQGESDRLKALFARKVYLEELWSKSSLCGYNGGWYE